MQSVRTTNRREARYVTWMLRAGPVSGACVEFSPVAIPVSSEGDSVAVTTTRSRFWVTSAVFSSSFRPLLAALPASGAVKPRARVTSVARRSLARRHVVAGGNLLDSHAQGAYPGNPGVTLAMMVESSSSGRENPKIWMAPLSEKGSPICPTPQASASSGTSW